MAPNKLGIFANLALAASAVLIPPEISSEDFYADMQSFAIDPYKRSVALQCPGCATAIQEDKSFVWKGDTGNAFLLDFAVGPGQETLEIDNGYQLYPPVVDEAIPPFYITQINPDADNDKPLRLRVTSYMLSYKSAETISEDGTELFPMTLQIGSLEGNTVEPPALTINVLKDAAGRLMIASIKPAPASEATSPEQEMECNEWPLLCKWKGIVADRIEKMRGKGCRKRPHGHYNPMEEDFVHGKPPHRFHPGRPHHYPHHRPHHGGHRHYNHHGQHRLRMFANRAVFTVLIPIVIGIFAGTVTYLLGMALGTLIAIVIAKVRGQEYQRIALEEDVEEQEASAQSEKAEYAELPAYEAPPVYEEAPEKEVAESK